MPDTTTRGFRRPTATDPASSLYSAVRDLADDVDGEWRTSVFASRPAVSAVKQGTFHLSSDTNRLSMSDGAIWRDVLVGGGIIQSPAVGTPTAVFRAIAGQTGDLLAFQDIAGTAVSRIGSDGHFGTVAPNQVIGHTTDTYTNFLRPAASNRYGFAVRAQASQSADVFRLEDSTGAAIMRVLYPDDGRLYSDATGGYIFGNYPLNSITNQLTADNAAAVALAARGVSGQTASIFQVLNNVATPLFTVSGSSGETACYFAVLGALRTLVLGATDSAGSGFRTVRVAN